MRVTKCDRCGKIYDESIPDDYENKSWRFKLSYDTHPYPETIMIDLCDDCKESLYAWLKEGGYND